MKSLVKLGLIAAGGYLAYDWYKKRNSKKGGVAIGAPTGIDAQYENVPFTEQPESVQMGDHLTISQKEQYILENGNVSVFSGDSMSSADGDTDNVVLEAALAEEDGEEGFGAAQTIGMTLEQHNSAIADSTPANILKDHKCLLSKMKEKFPETDWDSIHKDHVDSLYVSVKCQKSKEKGEVGCEKTGAAQKAAAKGKRASDKIKAKNPQAVAAILKGCIRERRAPKGIGIKSTRRTPFNNPANYEQSGLRFKRPNINAAIKANSNDWGSSEIDTGI